MPSEEGKPVASSLPGEVKPEPKPPTLAEVLTSFDARLKAVEGQKEEIISNLKAWMGKMEKASTGGTATQNSQAAAQGEMPPWLSPLIDRGMNALGVGTGSGMSALEQTLTQEMMRGYTLWIRNSIKQMNRAFGVPEHMTVG